MVQLKRRFNKLFRGSDPFTTPLKALKKSTKLLYTNTLEGGGVWRGWAF